MPAFTHQGCLLHYETYGQGPTILLLHGLGSSGRDWEYQLPALTSHFRVICPDFRGHGQSSKPRGPYSIAGFAADIGALLDHLQTGPVHLVGLSMGGMVGFQMAVDQPQRLLSLCIVNSAPEVKVRTSDDLWQYIKRRLIAQLLSMRTLGKALGKNLFPHSDQQALRDKVAQRWAANDKRAYMASFKAIVGWGVAHGLRGITCPTLVISADRDYTPVSLKQDYVEKIPGAQLVVIEHSRHATPLDQPEAFNRALLNFLKA